MSLDYSSICGTSDTLLAGSVGAQKLEGVFFHSCSWCTWHQIGVSFLSDLFVGFLGVDVSVFTWSQVRCSGQFACVGAHRLPPVLVAGVWEQCNHSPWDRSADSTFPEQCQSIQRWHNSCHTSEGWTKYICPVWEGGLGRTFASSVFSFPQSPPSCHCFGLFHIGFCVPSSDVS